MNLEKAFPWFVFLCMAVGGTLAHRNGISPVAGIACGFAVGMLPLFLLFVIGALMFSWRPERPPCACGKCNSDEYDYVGPMQKPDDKAYYYKCPRCSREYRLIGPKFDLKSAQGYSPYMEISKWQRWKRSIQQSL